MQITQICMVAGLSEFNGAAIKCRPMRNVLA